MPVRYRSFDWLAFGRRSAHKCEPGQILVGHRLGSFAALSIIKVAPNP
ncbi:hypothetical protein SAMN05216214_11368 [Atopomonas hussainii]|uniref:Uncharacterized protein n=1 Tax=Atopomonas hussainii TaxID=1429083 RepID=A0A1H7QUE3_9GAMM|nr:hypothetical protein SAMN05216214_11368 [Atopomonas hussainii]